MEFKTAQYPTLRARLAITLIVLATVFSAGVSSVLYMDFRQELRANLRNRLETITKLAALQQDGDSFLKVKSQNDAFFQQIHETNLKIKRSEPELRFVYTMKKVQENIHFVVDAGMPGEALISSFGDLYEEPSQTLADNFDTMAGTVLEPDLYADEFGTFLSGYAPIYASDGQRVGVLGVDIAADTILAQERRHLVRFLLIFFGTLPFIVGAGVISANYLARPIVQLSNAAKRISEGEYSFKLTEIPHTRELAEMAMDFNIMSDRLSGLINDLEQRVAERTESLIRKSQQLRTASYIAQKTAEVQELPVLLDMVARLVTNQFGFYHTGIFLINETGEQAVLLAASSEGGQRMIERGHTVAVGKQGIVGYVAAHRKARITLDVGTDAVFFNNPDLPMTRSELALPLLIRNKVLGILDIQSDQPQAFTIDDIDVLQTLADQVAVAIENARLLDESRAALTQLEAVIGARTREAWHQRLQGKGLVFTYTPLGLRAEKLPDVHEKTIRIPLTLRGQMIGNISIARKGSAALTKSDEALIAEVASQAGLAIDNIRLLEEATQRAKQEQMVGNLAARFSQSLDMDTLLQTAARELAHLPDVSEVSVFIGKNSDEPPVRQDAGKHD
jgi:GAF domain-containing protein/HAMP domain-containing protein